MNYYLGTNSKQKIEYVRSEIRRRANNSADLIPVEVDSAVSGQPFGLSETKIGAINRAKTAYGKTNDEKKIGIGMEAGLQKNQNSELYLICVACIYDGEKEFIAVSTPLLIPKPVSKRVLLGREFGKEIRDYQTLNPKGSSDFSKSDLDELVNREVSFRYVINKCLEMINS